MGEGTKIEWADNTFNPWIGCRKVSPGCANCYAETLNKRHKWAEWGKGGKRFLTSDNNWGGPLRWQKRYVKATGGLGPAFLPRPRVFCGSMCDWLDPEVPAEWLASLLAVIYRTQHLQWMLLTKRPELFRSRMRAVIDLCRVGGPSQLKDSAYRLATLWGHGGGAFPRNVWLGVSAEDQTRWDERVSLLMALPAERRFVSAEPLLGPLDMGEWRPDWLIVGGESGPGARPMEADWASSLRDDCGDRTKFFFKQWGGVNKRAAGRQLDGEFWNELPETGVLV